MHDHRVVLVLEPDPAIARLLEAVLRTGGFSSVVANDARGALQLLLETTPIAFVVDVNRHPSVLEPGKHRGIGFLRHLERERPALLGRVVVLSALAPREIAKELPHIRRFLRKPFDIAELLAAVSESAAAESVAS